MAIELKVPEVGESITEVFIAQWLVKPGEPVKRDQALAELESDKATIELPAPIDGVMGKQVKGKGESAEVGEVIGLLEEGAAQSDSVVIEIDNPDELPQLVARPKSSGGVTPAARRAAAEAGVDVSDVAGSGKGGMVLKSDIKQAQQATSPNALPPAPASAVTESTEYVEQLEEDIVPMSPIRRTIATRLLDSQQSSAQLTTFQEVDMSAVFELRKKYKEMFLEKYGTKLGLMSFFVKAAIEALKAYPAVNAEIRGNNIVYKNYYNIGIAVGGGKGLVVPVMRNAQRLSIAQVEAKIADFGKRAGENKIALDELTGGTFTISNGGVYGSMLSTPILNPPQSGVLGLHAIKERPVVVAGEIAIRPVMYLALTYDHRMVDGRESVGFLMKVKETIEDPARILLEV